MEEMMNKDLAENEIKRRRGILFGKFGPYAFAMTNEQVEAVYEKMYGQSNQSLSPIVREKHSTMNSNL